MRLITAAIKVYLIETIEESLAFEFLADEEECVVYGGGEFYEGAGWGDWVHKVDICYGTNIWGGEEKGVIELVDKS